MKNKFLLILTIFIPEILFSQTMTIHKNDNSTVDFQLSEIDSMNFSVMPSGKTVSSANWICFTDNSNKTIELSQGIYEDTEEGLKIYGGGNGNSLNLIPADLISLTSKTIYLKWKVYGDNIDVGIELYSELNHLPSDGNILNISNQQSGSINIDTWYYTRISVTPDVISSFTSYGNYDNSGGAVISKTSIVASNIKTFSFKCNGDNSSCSVLADYRIE